MKNLSLLTFAILLSTAAFSQHIGVKGGLNISNLSIEDGDVENRFAYHFGGVISGINVLWCVYL